MNAKHFCSQEKTLSGYVWLSGMVSLATHKVILKNEGVPIKVIEKQ